MKIRGFCFQVPLFWQWRHLWRFALLTPRRILNFWYGVHACLPLGLPNLLRKTFIWLGLFDRVHWGRYAFVIQSSGTLPAAFYFFKLGNLYLNEFWKPLHFWLCMFLSMFRHPSVFWQSAIHKPDSWLGLQSRFLPHCVTIPLYPYIWNNFGPSRLILSRGHFFSFSMHFLKRRI